MMSDSLCEHCFPCARRTIKQHSAWRVNADLSVQFMVCERELHGLANLLFLNIIAPDILRLVDDNLVSVNSGRASEDLDTCRGL